MAITNFPEVLRIFSFLLGYAVVLCLMVAGVVMMVAPSHGCRMLKNTGVAVVVFILGWVVLALFRSWMH
jgi:cytochrome c biogenesis protein CcdA